MTHNMEIKKYKIIEKILQINKESVLDKIGDTLSENIEQSKVWKKLSNYSNQEVSLEKLALEQGFEKINPDQFFKMTEELEIEESIEELLSMLNS